jgi:hypothetical protein
MHQAPKPAAAEDEDEALWRLGGLLASRALQEALRRARAGIT